jgi:hypothetical protein
MAEGILKPYIASQIHNKIFLGASGANFGSSPEQLKIYLEALSKEFQDNVVDFYPDAGAVGNTHVIRSYRKTFDLLDRLGYEVRVAWWGQAKKLDKDCDEICSDEAIAYISLQEFEDICIQHGGFIPPAFDSVPTEELSEEELEEQRKEEFYAKVIAAQRPLRTLSYKPDLVFTTKDGRYLPNLVGKIPEKGIVLLRCPKGSGKSHQIKEVKNQQCGVFVTTDKIKIEVDSPKIVTTNQLNLLNSAVTSKNEIVLHEREIKEREIKEFAEGLGKRFVSVTPRIALGREQAVRWEYTWIDDISSQASIVEGEEYRQLNEAPEIGCCFDSFWKLGNRDFSNTLMILDECELGLSHMVSSSTLKRNRSLILRLFEEKVRECLKNNGLLILSDADLTDVSVDYIRSICPSAPVFLVDYQGCPEPWEIDLYTGHQDDVEKLILDWFDSENEYEIEEHGQPIHITTDSQDEAEALEKQLLKRYPELGERIGGIIRIDSTTTQTDFGRNFVKYPNKSIEELKPKILISTPSLGVGVSLDIPHFKVVFSLFFGTIEPSQARQQLARVRQGVPRIIWVKNKGIIEYGIMGSFFPDEIKANLFQHNESTSELIGIALELARESTENQCDATVLPALIKTLQGMMNLKGEWDNKHIDLRCKIQARRNFSLSQLALQLRQELIEEGHQVTDYGCPEKNSAGEDVREQKEEDKLVEAEAIANAADIEFKVAKEKSLKPTRTVEEGHQIQKAFLKEELPSVELSAEFVHKAVTSDRGRWKAGIKLFWHCKRLEATKARDLSEWRYKLKMFEKGQPFLPDIKTRSLQCKALIESGLFDFLSPERLEIEYIAESPELRGFWGWAQKHQGLLKKAFGMTIGKDPIYLLGRLFLKIGLTLQKSRSEKLPNGNKLRFYKIDAEALTDPDRHAILTALDLRWQLQQEEKLERERAWMEMEKLSKQEAVEPSAALPISQSQREVESWGQTHSVYNNIGECDTACIAHEGGVSADFEAMPESDQCWRATIRAYAGLLVEGMACGVEVIKTLLKPWSIEERWGAMLEFEVLAPEKMRELLAIAPNCFEWCDA